MTEEQELELSSAYGDGWYDGFLEAKKLDEDKDFYLEDIKENEVLEMSEHAESKSKLSTRNKWIDADELEPKNEKNMYWVQRKKGDVIMCHLNDYKQYGGARNLWQTLGGNDFEFDGTKYIELSIPDTNS